MQGGREGGSGYDIRLFEKPRPFCGQETDFTEFRFRLHSYLDVVDEKFTEEVEAAEQHTGPIALPTEEATARRGRALYALLVGLLSGRGLKVLQGVTKHKRIRSHRCAEEERPGRTPDGDSDLSKEVTPKPRSCGKMGADLHRTSAHLAQSGRGKGRHQGQR